MAGGRVAVDGAQIVWVGAADQPGAPDGEIRDLGRGVLLPGLVNAHCHLELSHLYGHIDRSHGFVAWVRALVDARRVGDSGRVRSGAQRALRDLFRGGTAALGDVSNELQHLGVLAAAGIRTVIFYELIAWEPTKTAEVLEAALHRRSTLEHSLRGSGASVRLAAHAPHSVSAEFLRALVAAGGPAAIHLAESAAESRFLLCGDGDWRVFLAERGLGQVAFHPPGCSPVAYADSLGVLRPGLVAAHCVEIDAADARTLAERGVHVALCPRSNRALGNRMPPLPLMLEAGVRLCLGTDSLASVDSLDVLQDAALLHREFPEVDAHTLLRMATRGGAEALGFDELGTLEPGRRAALAFAPSDVELEDPLEFLLSGDARTQRVAL
jgi:cytosine/adenosine deaminase-related metal-dependent hydrolase